MVDFKILDSLGLQRIGHDWATKTHTHTHTHFIITHIIHMAPKSNLDMKLCSEFDFAVCLPPPRGPCSLCPIGACMLSHHHVWLFETSWSPPGSFVHGIFQAKILDRVTCPPPWDLPNPGTTHVSHISCIDRWVLYHQCHLGSLLIGYTSIQNKS